MNAVGHPSETPPGRKIALAILIIILAAIYALRLDHVAGLWKDDAWYITLAKSMATGHGYRLINFPDEAGVYYYPPGFPVLLSFLYRLYPHFPQNVFLLKSASVLAMALLGVLFYKLLRLKNGLSDDLVLLAAVCTVASPALVFMATSNLMSESVFAALQMATLLIAEKYIRRDDFASHPGSTVFIALLASLTFLVRSFGIVVIAAIVIFLAKQKLFRPMLVFIVALAMFVAPWSLYKRQLEKRTSPAAQARLPGAYTKQFLERVGGSGVPMPVTDFPARVWQNLTAIVAVDTGAVFFPSAYRQQNESGVEVSDTTLVAGDMVRDIQGGGKASMGNALGTKLISLALSMLLLLGFIHRARIAFSLMELLLVFYLALVLSWGGPPLRYLVPVIPLLFFYLIVGCQRFCEHICRFLRPNSPIDCRQFARLVLLCILGLFIYDHAGYIVAKHFPQSDMRHPDWLRRYEANRQASQWIRDHTPPNEVVAADNLPLTYLLSDRKTDKCAPGDCPKLGIRYYVASEDAFEFPANQVRFDSGYPYVKVAEMLPRRNVPAPVR